MQLPLIIGQVHRLSTKKFVQNSHNSGLDISMDQWIVLGPIWENEGISHKEISEYCDQNKWNSIWYTEHHFSHEGMESCTNPLMMGSDAAARTKQFNN